MDLKQLTKQIEKLTKIKKTIEKLNKMKNAKAVAKLFEKNNILGFINDGDHCPLSNYLSSELNAVISTHYSTIIIGKKDSPDIFIDTPNVLVKFIRDFDKGKFPNITLDQNPNRK